MNNKTILILGASSDIGIATCMVFLKKNWNVIGHYYSNNYKLKVLKEKYPGKLALFKLNLENPELINSFLKKKKNFFSSVDSFVSLIGFMQPSSSGNLNHKIFLKHININYYSNLLFINVIRKFMIKKKWGRILLSSSIGTKFGGSDLTFAYSISKFCNEFIPNLFRKKLAKYILYNVIQIGVTKTKIHKRAGKKNLDKRVKLIPTNRIATPTEVANEIYNLNSENNQLIHNQIVNISGGE
jgi:3-oxoacyl-[acyl-carrier protein] reductase